MRASKRRKDILRLSAWLLTAALLVGLLPATALAADGETGEPDVWDGETDTDWFDADTDKFVLTTAAQLAGMAELGGVFSGKTVVLEADLDLGGLTWTPIGPFHGDFDGGGHTVSNLYIDGGADNQGLFSTVNGGSIKNLTVKGEVANSGNQSDYTGGIAGAAISYAVIENCVSDVTVSGGTYYTGGIVGGISSYAQVIDCTNEGAVSGNYDVGGIVGRADSTEGISGCVNNGVLSGSYDVGGIVGRMEAGMLSASYNTGDVRANEFGSGRANSNYGVGGIAGVQAANAVIERCYNTGDIETTYFKAGGIVGFAYPYVDNVNNILGPVVISNCYNMGDVTVSTTATTATDNGTAGGIVGEANATTMTGCYNTGTVTGTTATGELPYIGGVAGRQDNTSSTLASQYDTNFYREDSAASGIPGRADVGAQVESRTEAYMRSEAFAAELGEAYVYVEGGYPELSDLIKQYYDLTVVISPVGANVQFQLTSPRGLAVYPSVVSGTTYTYYNLEAGAYTYEAEAQGYVSQTGEITLDGDTRYTITLEEIVLAYWGDRWLDEDGEPDSTYADISWYNADDSAFTVSTAAELSGLAYLVNTGQDNFSGKTVALGCDIDLSNPDSDSEEVLYWTPIGNSTTNSFQGTFDGQNHTVNGMFIGGGEDYQGLFGYVYTGSLENLIIGGDCDFSQCYGSYVGGIVGYLGVGAVECCLNYANIQGGTYVGGIGGSLSNPCDVHNYGDISGGYYVGGVAGRISVSGVAEYLSNHGAVTATSGDLDTVGSAYYDVGGIGGSLSGSGTLQYCHNTGEVTGNIACVGGIIGHSLSTQTVIRYCYNTGDITSTVTRATAVPRATHTSPVGAGGITGWLHGTTVYGADVSSYPGIRNCYNTGTVSSATVEIELGAIVGYVTPVGYSQASVWSGPSGDPTTLYNNYYLEGTAAGGSAGEDYVGETYEIYPKGDEELKSKEIIAQLGENGYRQAVDSDENGGYPVLLAADEREEEQVYVTFTLDPADAEVTLYGDAERSRVIDPEEGGGYLLDLGDYYYTAEAEGYYTVDSSFTVSYNDVDLGLNISLNLTLPRYTVTFVTSPEDALVDVYDSGGGKRAAQVDGTYLLENGTYTYGAWAMGYDEVYGEFTVNGEDLNVYVDMDGSGIENPDPEAYTVTFTVTPEEAEPVISVRDGQNAAVSGGDDGTYLVTPGTYGYTVSAEGYITQTGSFTVTDRDVAVLVELVPGEDEAETYPVTFAVSPEGAEPDISVRASAGRAYSAEADGTWLLPSGVYTYTVRAGGYVARVGALTVEDEALTVQVALTAAPEVTPQQFTDLDEGEWYYEAVVYVIEQGLFVGTGDSQFTPDGEMTRAMFVQAMARLAGVDESEYTGSDFPDVPEDEWYTSAVRWASENKIVEGNADGTFAPDGLVTREQMATVLYRLMEYLGAEPAGDSAALDAFPDGDKVSDWARDAMAWATANGIVNGNADGTLEPGAYSTRAQVAQLLMNYIETYMG